MRNKFCILYMLKCEKNNVLRVLLNIFPYTLHPHLVGESVLLRAEKSAFYHKRGVLIRNGVI